MVEGRSGELVEPSPRGEKRVGATSVVSVGFRADEFLAGEEAAVSLPLGPERGELDDLYDALVGPLERPTIAIVPKRWAERAIRRLETVQLVSERPPMAFYVTDLPPLAGGVLTALAAALGARIRDAGVLLAALPAVERELIWVTWLRRITRLSSPSPSLGQRLRSAAPGRRWVVSSWPEPSIHTVSDRRKTPALPELLAQFQLAVAPNDGDPEWPRAVSSELSGVPTREYEPTPLGASWWGTDQVIETVAFPIDVEALAVHASSGVVAAACRWCGERIASSSCPFCGHALGPIRSEPAESESEPRVGAA